MANRRVLVKRRKAARNIRKITRTMQLIATARFQSIHNAAASGRPYTDKLAELVEKLARAAKSLDHPLMAVPEENRRRVLLILTSNRGLCGGYNANVLKTGLGFLDGTGGAAKTDVYVVGKKGIAYLKFLGREVAEEHAEISDSPKFEEAEPLANELMARFIRGEIDSVSVAYMKFLSAGKQQATVEQVLPLQRSMAGVGAESAESAESDGSAAPARELEYEFSPEPAQILEELLPATVRVRFYQMFMDAAVSEQIARMVAMKAATDAAGEMIKRLTQEYNRARQTQITMELLDIVGGANALA